MADDAAEKLALESLDVLLSTLVLGGPDAHTHADTHVHATHARANRFGQPWTPFSVRGVPYAFTSTVPSSSIRQYLAVHVVPAPPERVFECLIAKRREWDTAMDAVEPHTLKPIEVRLQAADAPTTAASASAPAPIVLSRAAEGGIVCTGTLSLLRCASKGAWGVSPRDFVDATVTLRFPARSGPVTSVASPADRVRGAIVSTGSAYTHTHAHTHAVTHPQPGYVRGENHPGCGWLLEPVPAADGSDREHTRLHYLIHSDVKGWLPAAIVHAAMGGTYAQFFAQLIAYIQAH